MKSRNAILIAHYRHLAGRMATWLGLGAILSTMFLPVGTYALGTQMGHRSVTPVTLAAGSTTSYAISFSPSATQTIGSLKIELCDSPLESVACAASASAGINSNGASAVAATFSSLTGTGCTGGTWATGAGTGPGVAGTSRKLTNSGSAVAPTAAQTCVLTFGSIINPAGNNQQYYLRLTTYSDTAYTTETDFGGFALQTAQNLTVTASVQEQLEFCIGANSGIAGCGTTGSGAISLATGTGCPVLTTANVCTGLAYMAAATNASTGYSITFNGSTLTGPSDTVTDIGGAGATSSPGSKQFGLAITTKAGAGSGTVAATYDFGSNGSKYAFANGVVTTIASAAAATAENVYTITYAANVTATTKPGLYTSTFNYVCTGLF